MKRTMKRILIMFAVASLLGSAASAQCRCTSQLRAHLLGSNKDRDIQTRSQNESRVENADRIIAAIRASAGQTSAYIQRHAAASEKLSDSSDLNASIRVRESLRAEAEGGRYDPAASSCGGYAAAAVLAGGADPPPDAPPLPATGADTQNQGRNYERCAGGNEEVCRGAGAVVNGIIADRDRLRDVGGVQDPTSDIRLLLQQPTTGSGTASDPADIDAAVWRLSQNILQPIPPTPVTSAEAGQPGGRAEIARRQSEAARRSAPAALLGWIQTRSAAQLPLGDWARSVAPDGYPYPIGERISVRQFYDVAVSSGWRHPDWHTRLAGMSPEAVMREVAVQLALSNDLSHLRFELDLHRAAVEAAVAATVIGDGG